MAQIRTLFATPERYRAWLQSKRADAQVGRVGGISSCPLYWFVKEHMQVKDIWVLPGQSPCVIYGRGSKQRSVALPAWAVKTAHKMDSLGRGGMPITAAEALGLLNNVIGAS